MKRIIASLGAVALLGITGSAAATTNITSTDDSFVGLFMSKYSSLKVSNSNTAVVENVVSSSASTGGNTVSAKEDVEGAKVVTGDAASAAEASNHVNTIVSTVETGSSDCGCEDGDLNVVSDDDSKVIVKSESAEKEKVYNNNAALVANVVASGASTGDNTVKSWHDDVEGAKILTGVSLSGSSVGNFVNKTISHVVRY